MVFNTKKNNKSVTINFLGPRADSAAYLFRRWLAWDANLDDFKDELDIHSMLEIDEIDEVEGAVTFVVKNNKQLSENKFFNP